MTEDMVADFERAAAESGLERLARVQANTPVHSIWLSPDRSKLAILLRDGRYIGTELPERNAP